jgi:membrane protein YqaA with SNARE-associated domain
VDSAGSNGRSASLLLIVIFFAIVFVFLFFVWLFTDEDIRNDRVIRKEGAGAFWMHSAHSYWYASNPLANAGIPKSQWEELFKLKPDRRKATRSSIIEPVTSFIAMLRHLGGIGVFILAALDSSVLPTFGAVDALTIVLAARNPEVWPYYAMCSTAGSVCGASVAYRLSGLGILHRRIKGRVFDKVSAFLKRFASLALSLAALLPPPFPTSAFVLTAGATRYRFTAFALSFGTGRACRFALLAYFASVFGRRSVSNVWSAHTLLLVAAVGAMLVCVGLLAWLVFRKSEGYTPFGM